MTVTRSAPSAWRPADFIKLLRAGRTRAACSSAARLRIKGDWKLAMKFKKLSEIMGGQK